MNKLSTVGTGLIARIRKTANMVERFDQDVWLNFISKFLRQGETHKSSDHKSLQNFKSLRFFGDFWSFSKTNRWFKQKI